MESTFQKANICLCTYLTPQLIYAMFVVHIAFQYLQKNKTERKKDQCKQNHLHKPILMFWLFRVEVTNKANQTPSHWVYTDMTIEEDGLIYPFSAPLASQSTFNSYVANSSTRYVALSATYRKTYKQNMYILISYIQVKSLVADTLCTIFVYCIFVYTGKKCVSY